MVNIPKTLEPMITFHWRGINQHNEHISGDIQATHLLLAKNTLLSQGILLKSIAKKPTYFKYGFSKKIKASNITVFSRQLATLIKAGIPLVQACQMMASTQNNAYFGQLIHQIKHDIESGATLSESLQKHPRWFNALFCQLTHIGEQSGTLDIMLEQLTAYQEKLEAIQKKIKKALIYPVVVLMTALIVISILLILIIPQLQRLYNDFGAELPRFTRLIIDLSMFLQKYGLSLIVISGSLLSASIYLQKHTRRWNFWRDRLLLNLPVFGPTLKKTVIARFFRTLAITFSAGLPLPEALQLVGGACDNQIFATACEKMRKDVTLGQSLHQAIKNTQLFPSLALQMTAIGEASGKLDAMLVKVAEFNEEEAAHDIEILGSLLEPMLMIFMGIFIAGLLIAVYLPIFKLGSVI